MQSIIRFVKGMFMGFADVVPGVSGGTVALVLGIYIEFIESIKSLNIRWIPALFRWLTSGFEREHLDEAWSHVRAIHWGFLIPLGAGIVVAFAIGSKVIPGLMDDHPAQMRAFFMGLVLASIVVPFQQIRRRSAATFLIALAVAAVTFLLVGAGTDAPARWKTFSADQEVTFKHFVRQHPSTRAPISLYCDDVDDADNSALRTAIMPPEGYDTASLDRICEELDAAGDDVEQIARINHEYHLDDNDVSPFDQSVIPARTPVNIPQPAFWYVLICGMLAICAMVLPGISGSFILLMLGSYFFVLSSIKGSIEYLTGSGSDLDALIYVSLFSVGALIGITSFVRVLSWLFEKYHDVTLAALIGLMLGSLRVLWPFKLGSVHGGPTRNVLPTDGDPLAMVITLVVVGFVLVIGLSVISDRIDRRMSGPDDA